MKLIIENFRKFLSEQNFISEIPLEQDEEGKKPPKLHHSRV
jgi:hypothetical protein